MSTELYNLIALAGLLLGKVALLLLIAYYCCKRKFRNRQPDASTGGGTQDSGIQTEDPEEAKADIPPTYSTLVLKVDPPEYLDSVMNEELNPELNKDWAERLQKGAVSPVVSEIIERSRQNSTSQGCCHGQQQQQQRRASTHSPAYAAVAAAVAARRSMRRASAADAAAAAAARQPPAIGAFWIGV